MITPSRWFTGGMGLDNYRLEMMKDKQIVTIVDYTNAKDCFPQISISGGVSYFLRTNTEMEECEIVNIHNGNVSKMRRPLDEFPVLVRYNEAVSILRKVAALKETTLDTIISPISPYGLSTKERGQDKPDSQHSIKLYSSQGFGFVSEEDIEKGFSSINTYRVMISKATAEHAGEPSKDGRFRVLTKTMCIMHPNEICTHSYIYAGEFDSPNEAENLLNYLRTKFVRFLILQALTSINLTKSTFVFVPIQDFSKAWTDEDLYRKYGLDKLEISFIDSMVKPFGTEEE